MCWSRDVWTRFIICVLLLTTATFDFITFAIDKKSFLFDWSPLTLITNNIIVIFLVKYIVVGALCYLLFSVKQASDYWKFLWVMMSLYLIVFQIVGGIANLKVDAKNIPVEQAPTVEQRKQAGFNIAMYYAYYPIIFSMISFFLWNKGWRYT